MPLVPVVPPSGGPTVPSAPGVPPLNRIGNVVSQITLLGADAALIARAFNSTPQWGIFDSTTLQPVMVADSVLSFDFSYESRLSDYPVEQGGFATYDKVAEPFDIRLSFALSGKGTIISNLLGGGIFGALINGDPAARQRGQYLNQIDALAAGLNLYRVVTPEITYPSCNVVHYDYRRDLRGASLFAVDVWLREVRIAPPAVGSSVSLPASQVQNPPSASPTSGGSVQTAPATTSQTQAFSAALVST